MKHRVYVTGLGVVSAIGNSANETMGAFREQRDGIGSISVLETAHKAILPAGEVKLGDSELRHTLNVGKKIPRAALLGMQAIKEALNDSALDHTALRTGLISATTVGGMDLTESFFDSFIKGQKKGKLSDVVHHECGSVTELMADYFGINAFVSTINTACSSSVNSIIGGARLIAHGLLDVVVAGGTDALTRFTLNGFNSLMILDKSPCRPFDESRAGLNLGEGAGFLVLVSEEAMKKANLNAYGYIRGYANTNDAFHQTASSPEGTGPYNAMKNALYHGGLVPGEIDYINVHGTGTENNDSAEGRAVNKVFGDQLPRLSSTKAFTGHTLGASGGIESVFSLLAIRHQCVFPNLRFDRPVAESGIVPQQFFEDQLPVRNVLNNSFGFGGNCSSVIFSAAES